MNTPPAPTLASYLPERAASGPGVTTIGDRAVESIAARAVAEVDLATGAPRQVLGMRVGGVRADTPARVDAAVTGEGVRVRIAVSVRWPAPITRVTRQVRAHVTERLRTLTGLRVEWVDITVTALPTGHEAGRVS